MTTTPHIVKPETQVNTTDRGTQFQGEIAALHDGGYVVVWTDISLTYNSLGEAIVGQRYDAAGNKVGGDPAHGGEVNLSLFTTGDQSDPAVTTLANGDIAVAFVDSFSGNDDIYVRVFDPSLHLIRTDSIEVSSTVHGFDPSLTALADGSYAVSYTVGFGTLGSGPDDHVVGRFVSASGSVGGQFNIAIAGGGGIIFDSSHLATLPDGNIVAVMEEKSLTNGAVTDSDIAFNFFNPARTPAPAPSLFFFPGGAGDGMETQPDVAALSNGGFVVVWTDPDGPGPTDIRAAVLSNGGGALASNILVNTTTAGQQDHASVVALADGGFMVSWRSGNAVVEAQRFDALGHKVGVEFTLHGNVANHADAALLSDGHIAFAIDNTSTGDPDVATSIWSLGSTAVASGDFNGDGTMDILWQSAAGATSEWLMSPSGGIAGLLGTPPAAGWSVVAGGDFNGDGTDDILWKNDATGATAEWLMARTGGASLLGTPAAPGWNVVASGDFNNDGTTDIMWKHAATGSTAEWLMAPTGGVGSLLSAPPVGGWNLIASGDFNGDGSDDLMWQNAGTGATSEWLMAGGSVASNPFTPAAPGWNVVATGDFNGDHITDIMWQHAATGATSDWLMAPTGGAGSLLGTPPVGGWNLIASGDFNGDGTDDLMWQNAGTGATSEWLMAGGSVASNPFTPAAPGWNVVAAGDLNGDAMIDLMWQNALTGATSEWLMAPGGGVGAFIATPLT